MRSAVHAIIGRLWLSLVVGRVEAVDRIFTYRTLLHAIAISFVVAQVVVWAFEIRGAGFKQWLRASATKSYVQYFSLLSRTQRLHLLALWGLFFVVIMLALIFV